MNDMQDEVRQLLRDKATDMPPHLEVPSSLTRRVWPRIARNALIVAASAAVLTVGAIAGIRSLNEPVEQPLDHGTSTAAGSQCGFDQLHASLALEGAAGSRVGSVRLQNIGGVTCTLQGPASPQFLDSDLHVFDGVEVASGPPAWRVSSSPRPDGWPVVTLAAGDVASIRFGWSNWCPRDVPSLLRISTSDASEIAQMAVSAVDVPPCNGRDMPSTVEVGPFEPGS